MHFMGEVKERTWLLEESKQHLFGDGYPTRYKSYSTL